MAGDSVQRRGTATHSATGPRPTSRLRCAAMPRGTRHCRSSVAAAVLALASAVLGTGCETPVVSRFELVPRAAARPDEVVIRRRVAPGEIDAERARRALAAWFDAATPDRRVSTPVAEWPSPEGCRWVRVPGRVDVGAGGVT